MSRRRAPARRGLASLGDLLPEGWQQAPAAPAPAAPAPAPAPARVDAEAERAEAEARLRAVGIFRRPDLAEAEAARRAEREAEAARRAEARLDAEAAAWSLRPVQALGAVRPERYQRTYDGALECVGEATYLWYVELPGGVRHAIGEGVRPPALGAAEEAELRARVRALLAPRPAATAPRPEPEPEEPALKAQRLLGDPLVVEALRWASAQQHLAHHVAPGVSRAALKGASTALYIAAGEWRRGGARMELRFASRQLAELAERI